MSLTELRACGAERDGLEVRPLRERLSGSRRLPHSVRGDNERLCELSALAEGATSHESGYFSAMSIGRWWMATCVGLFIGGAAGAADPDGDADEPDAIVERDCLVDRPEGAETPLVAVTLSAKLQTARKRRQEAVDAARPKLVRLLEEARAKNGEATGPIADWIRRQFKQKPNFSLLVILNSSLTWGLRDAGTWVEPPAPRPDCTERKAAVAERFGTTVWLCNKFYEDGDDEAALTIYHESQHLAGVEDCPGIMTSATPVGQRMCASNYEALLLYLWKTAP